MLEAHCRQRPCPCMLYEVSPFNINTPVACFNQFFSLLHIQLRKEKLISVWLSHGKMIHSGVKLLVNDTQLSNMIHVQYVLHPRTQFPPIKRIVGSLQSNLAEPMMRCPRFMTFPTNGPGSVWKGRKSLLEMDRRNHALPTVPEDIKCDGSFRQFFIVLQSQFEPCWSTRQRNMAIPMAEHHFLWREQDTAFGRLPKGAFLVKPL